MKQMPRYQIQMMIQSVMIWLLKKLQIMIILHKKQNKNNKGKIKKMQQRKWWLILKLRWRLKEQKTWKNLLNKKQIFKNCKMELLVMNKLNKGLKLKFCKLSKMLRTLQQIKWKDLWLKVSDKRIYKLNITELKKS